MIKEMLLETQILPKHTLPPTPGHGYDRCGVLENEWEDGFNLSTHANLQLNSVAILKHTHYNARVINPSSPGLVVVTCFHNNCYRDYFHQEVAASHP